jgi:hypothetical protein
MRVIGNPHLNNEKMKFQINEKTRLFKHPLLLNEAYLLSILTKNSEVIDIGSSLRDKAEKVKSIAFRLDTLDINKYADYPNIQMDLCEKVDLPDDLKYDVVFCFSILEHCYDPFTASENLFRMLKRDSRIIGSVPFLFPFHCPENLEYQDYFRFTKHSFAALFPLARQINLYPMRGRVGAGLNIISQRYKDVCERRLQKITTQLNLVDQMRKPEQTSGFHFEIYN